MEIRLSDLGENIEQAHIAQWLIKDGGNVQEGEDLLEIVTDKASFIAISPCSGMVEIRVPAGTEIYKTDVVAIINDRG